MARPQAGARGSCTPYPPRYATVVKVPRNAAGLKKLVKRAMLDKTHTVIQVHGTQRNGNVRETDWEKTCLKKCNEMSRICQEFGLQGWTNTVEDIFSSPIFIQYFSSVQWYVNQHYLYVIFVYDVNSGNIFLARRIRDGVHKLAHWRTKQCRWRWELCSCSAGFIQLCMGWSPMSKSVRICVQSS